MRCAAAAALPLRFFDPKMIRWGGDHVEGKEVECVNSLQDAKHHSVFWSNWPCSLTGHAVLLGLLAYRSMQDVLDV